MDVAEALSDGRYRLLSVLGEGGMATVYRGYDTRLDVERAIKVLSPAMWKNASIRRRFEAEAQTMAKLHHPNIVAVQDVGVDGERSFMVMELVTGGSLMDLVEQRGPMDAVSACRAIAAILSALSVAHARGVVHRDIKPHNVLVTADGAYKVTDFGIAHIEDRVGPGTRTGTAMGTWAYMAPEQRNSAKHVDGRADLYAVGATLYVLLTREEPYDLYATEVQDELFANQPAKVRELLRRACRFRAEDRYANAQDMLEAVNDALRELAGGPAAIAPAAPFQPPRTAPTLAPAAGTMTLEGMDGAASATLAPSGTFVADELDADAGAQPAPAAPASTPAPGASLRSATLPPVQPASATTLGDDAVPAPPRRATGTVIGGVLAAVALVGWLAWPSSPPTPDTTQPQTADAPPAAEVEGPADATEPAAQQPAPTVATQAPAAAATPPTTPTQETESTRRARTTAASGTSSTPATGSTRAAASTPAPAAAAPTASVSASTAAPAAAAPTTPAPAASDQRAATATGTVFMNSQPWANLSVDGKGVGQTGWRGSLPVGKHGFTLTTSDGRTKTVSLEVRADAPTRYCWDFTSEAVCSR